MNILFTCYVHDPRHRKRTEIFRTPLPEDPWVGARRHYDTTLGAWLLQTRMRDRDTRANLSQVSQKLSSGLNTSHSHYTTTYVINKKYFVNV